MFTIDLVDIDDAYLDVHVQLDAEHRVTVRVLREQQTEIEHALEALTKTLRPRVREVIYSWGKA